jgi:TolB protein
MNHERRTTTNGLRSLLAAAALALAALTPAPASAAFPGRNGKIAFSGNLSGLGEYSIYAMRGRGGGTERLTERNGWEPSYSADGRKIVFTRFNQGQYDIWKMRADGSHLRRVTRTRKDEVDPAFSPGGRKLVFQRGGYVWTMSVNIGGDERKLGRGFSPRFSPDGRRIVFITRLLDLAVMRPSGSDVERLTETNAYETAPDFSPNGRRIVFERTPGRIRNDDLYSIRVDGTGLKRLTHTPGTRDVDPVFSPNGAWIAFASDRNRSPKAYDIYRMRTDGSGLKRLTTTPDSVEAHPTWGVHTSG